MQFNESMRLLIEEHNFENKLITTPLHPRLKFFLEEEIVEKSECYFMNSFLGKGLDIDKAIKLYPDRTSLEMEVNEILPDYYLPQEKKKNEAFVFIQGFQLAIQLKRKLAEIGDFHIYYIFQPFEKESKEKFLATTIKFHKYRIEDGIWSNVNFSDNRCAEIQFSSIEELNDLKKKK